MSTIKKYHTHTNDMTGYFNEPRKEKTYLKKKTVRVRIILILNELNSVTLGFWFVSNKDGIRAQT